MGRIVWRAAEMQLEREWTRVRGHLGAPAPGPAESPTGLGPGLADHWRELATRGRKREGVNWEIGIDIYKLLYIK